MFGREWKSPGRELGSGERRGRLSSTDLKVACMILSRLPSVVVLRMSILGMAIVVSPVAFAAAPATPDAPAQADQPKLDPSRIYRYDPITESFSPIDRAKLKPLHVYHRFSTVLNRWVWSKTTPDGRLEFAMGPGSVQSAFLFDLTATMEERMRVLEERAPALARMYAVQGARASLILGADGKWTLHGLQSVGHVYDLETSQRWEWHGDHRAEVVNGGGAGWRFDDGRFSPVWEGTVFSHCR